MDKEHVWILTLKEEIHELQKELERLEIHYELISPYPVIESESPCSRLSPMAKWALLGGALGGVSLYIVCWIGTMEYKHIVAGQAYHHPGFLLMGYIGAILGAVLLLALGVVIHGNLLSFRQSKWEELASREVRNNKFVIKIVTSNAVLIERILKRYNIGALK